MCKVVGRQRSMEESKDEGQLEPAAGDSSSQDTEAPPPRATPGRQGDKSGAEGYRDHRWRALHTKGLF